MEHYRSYTAEDFISDAKFQDWIFQKNEKNDQFWLSVTNAYPETASQIAIAKQTLEGISFVEEFPEAAIVEQSLEEVLHKIDQEGSGRLVKMNPVVKWLAAASVVLVAGLVYFLVTKKEASQSLAGGSKKTGNTIQPGGDKAVLTLTDGSTIILDSANGGIIASQGSSKVTNLDGQLSYNTDASQMNAAVVYNTITTPKGGQYQLTLADGSKVWLNSTSSLRFPTSFQGEKREVELTGEGYFEIAHNAAAPFTVKVNDTEVEVLGTHFNINSYSDEPTLKTTLLEGSVKVKKNGQFVYLHPGQQAIVDPKEKNIKIDFNVNIEEVIAWKNGKFLFHGADIPTIMRQVARWYDAEVVIEKTPSEPISGGLSRSENVTQLLKILEATGKVHFKINGKQIIVTTK